jgi:adenosylcobinamide-phosphate synthase
MGRLILFWEKKLYAPSRWAGTVFWAVCVLSTASAGLILWAAAVISPWIFSLAGLYLMTTLSATRSLHAEAASVEKALQAGDLHLASNRLSRIVSRETAHLDAPAMRRAVLETVGENLSDAVVAPMFFLAFFGLPGMIFYKLVNTMDSMVGYKTDRYAAFGWFAARADDVLNYLPARCTAMLLALLAPLGGGTRASAVRSAFEDHALLASPNAGWPEAALASALGVRLAGPGRYHGRLVDRSHLNARGSDPGPKHMARAWRLLYGVSIAAALATWMILGLARGNVFGLAGGLLW